MAYRIFLGHGNSDGKWAESIYNIGKDLGIDVYCFNNDIQPGEVSATKLQEAIRDSNEVVILITLKSVDSQYVNQEIGYGLRDKRIITPVVQIGIPEEKLAMLKGVDYIPFNPIDPKNSLTLIFKHLMKNKSKKERTDSLIGLSVGGLLLLLLLGGGGKE